MLNDNYHIVLLSSINKISYPNLHVNFLVSLHIDTALASFWVLTPTTDVFSARFDITLSSSFLGTVSVSPTLLSLCIVMAGNSREHQEKLKLKEEWKR